MSDNKNENWRELFGEDLPEIDTENNVTMSDEELAKYLAELTPDDPDLPDAGSMEALSDLSEDMEKAYPAHMDDTMVTDLHLEEDPFASQGQELYNTLAGDEATSVITDDIKSIYTSGRYKTLSEEETPGEAQTGETSQRQKAKTSKNKVQSKNNVQKETEETYDKRDYRPVRRRRNKRTGCMGGIMYFLFVVCISTALAILGWLAANDVLALNKPMKEATIEIPEDFDIDYVANELKRSGIIEYKFLFKLYASFSDAEEKIDPGTYTVSTDLDYRALVMNMQEGYEELTVKITLTEGMTLDEIFTTLDENGVCSAEELWEAATNYDFDYDFLSDETLGNRLRLEGYLFPDTYEFYTESSAQSAITRFLDNFDEKVTDEMYRMAENSGYTIHEILTVASLIEKEAGSDEERATIASVIYNRLNSDFRYLQIDATVQYILEERKEDLTYEDLLIDNPYNTYVYEGLPPGPICNPGLASIQAALEPADTEYYYYALNTEGTHNFFETYEEHQAFTESDEYGG